MNNIFDQMASTSADDQLADGAAAKETGANRIADDTPADGVQASQTSVTEKAVKDTAQELLRNGLIEEARKPVQFRAAVTHEYKINQTLEPFDLLLKLDTYRGVAWLAVNHGEARHPEDVWSHPLVRRQRLTLEQSLLVALLRQAFAMHEQKHGVGQSDAKVSIEELLPQFLTYLKDTGSDAKNESRLLSLLDQLKTYAIVSEVDKNQEVTIRPMIAHLANPDSLNALLRELQAQASGSLSQPRQGADGE